MRKETIRANSLLRQRGTIRGSSFFSFFNFRLFLLSALIIFSSQISS